MSSKSLEAIENIKRLCDENLQGAFELEIIDLYNPSQSSKQIANTFQSFINKIAFITEKNSH